MIAKNIFQANERSPYHLSVGAVVVNNSGLIAAHCFTESDHNYYILMRETVEPGELLEAALARGLQGEMGITGKVEKYLGSRVSAYHVGRATAQKTTLYFQVRLTAWKPSTRKKNDREGGGKTVWAAPGELQKTMKKQGQALGADYDESVVVERYSRAVVKTPRLPQNSARGPRCLNI
jgi:hypothetical protein